MQLNTQEGVHTVLQVGSMPPELATRLHREFTVLQLPSVGVERFLEENGSRVTIAVTTGLTGVSGQLMRALPNLDAVISFGVGFETIDICAAEQLGVVVSNTPDVLTDCVADLAVGLLIDCLRGISAADRFVRQGNWINGPYPLGTRVSGKRIGIVGLGRIGLATARRLEAFGPTIAYHSRNRLVEVAYPWYESLIDLASDSDVLIVAVSGGTSTTGLVSREVIAALGSDGYLINVARGTVVDENALVDALAQKQIAGAGLDVYTHEPRVPEALLALDNVVALPHLGSATTETRLDMANLFLMNLRQFIAEGTLTTPVS